jgi:pSer/pThr/pTyr-binding forkhead associated (FHA) protein
MFIKVNRENADPEVFEVPDQAELIIGSRDGCDFLISEPTISRKHLKLISEKDAFFVVDQGSTNGTFHDDERLIPGKRHEIFFEDEIVLGKKVSIQILEKSSSAKVYSVRSLDEGQVSSADVISAESVVRQNTTQVISLDEFKAAQLKASAIKKKEQRQKKKKEIQEKEKETNYLMKVLIVCSILVVAGFFGNKYWQSQQSKIKGDTFVNKIQSKSLDDEIEAELEGFRIPKASLLPRSLFISSLSKPKCEKEARPVCALMKNMQGQEGVIFEDNKYFVFVMADSYIKEAKSLFKEEVDLRLLGKIAFLIYAEQVLAKNLEFEKGSKLYFAFFYQDQHQDLIRLKNIAALKFDTLPLILEQFDLENFKASPDKMSVIQKLDPYFSVY